MPLFARSVFISFNLLSVLACSSAPLPASEAQVHLQVKQGVVSRRGCESITV